jgi:Zn-dependent protease
MLDPLQMAETILTAMPVFVFSLVFHEYAHALTAVRLGHGVVDYKERLTLNPMAHLDPMGSIVFPMIGLLMGGFIFGWAKPVQWQPRSTKHFWRDSMLVSIAGPLSNVLLMIAFALLVRAMVGSGALHALGPLSDPVFGMLRFGVFINALLAVFNMIPLPPLDGSKVLAYFLRPEAAWRLLSINPGMSMMIVLGLVFLGVLSAPIAILTRMAWGLAGLG